MAKKLTTEEFRTKLSKTHPNLELLSEYISTNIPINVRCKVHNYSYTTTPHMLVQGSNCKKCYNERRGQTLIKPKEVVLKCIEKKHGSCYLFPKFDTEYVNSKSKITVVCPKHGDFKMSVNKLMAGHGCRKCANENNGKSKRLTVESFLKKSTEMHSNKYTYPNLEKELETAKSFITVNCPEHGYFKQMAGTHKQGHGCPKCNESHLERDITMFLNLNNIVFEKWKN